MLREGTQHAASERDARTLFGAHAGVPQAFLTKQALSAMAMPSILQSIS